MSITTHIVHVNDVGHDLVSRDPLKLAVAGYLSRYKGSTLKDFTHDLKVYLDWCDRNGLRPLEAMRGHVELYVRWLEGTGWAGSTINRRVTVVAGFYRYACLDELIAKDPAVAVARPKVDRASQHRPFLNVLEFGALLNAARITGAREHALVALLGLSGLRISEACGLDVDSLTIEQGYDVIRFIGKGDKPAIVPLPLPVTRAVRELIGTRTDGPLLLNHNGSRMDRAAASRILDRLAAAASIDKHVPPHALRRTFCTSGLTSGVPLREMQLAMRHSSPNTTAIYDMAAQNFDRNASHRVASFMAGAAG
jgi:site-specific recombinase XerD